MKEVIALTMGIWKDSRVRPGKRFFVEDNDVADWFKTYAPGDEPEPPAKHEPMTLLEHAMQPIHRVSGTQPKKVGRPSDKNVI